MRTNRLSTRLEKDNLRVIITRIIEPDAIDATPAVEIEVEHISTSTLATGLWLDNIDDLPIIAEAIQSFIEMVQKCKEGGEA